MKYDSLRAFQKQLIDSASISQLAPVYLLQSKDAYEPDRAMELVLEELNKASSGSLSKVRLDGIQVDRSALGQELETLPFLSSRHVVMLLRVDKAKKEIQDAVLKYLARPSQVVSLVMTAEALRSNSKLYRKVEELGVVLDCKAQKAWEQEKSVPDWIVAEAARYGKQMRSDAAASLFRQIGSDRALLRGEIEKLCCYVGESREISAADVQALCFQGTSPVSPWDLGKAILAGETATAIVIGQTLLKDGVPVQVLLRQIRSQLQTDAQVCSILSTGGTADEVSQEFRYMKGRILQEHVQGASRYGMGRFRRGLILIDEAELQSKSSAIDPELLIELLMVRLTH